MSLLTTVQAAAQAIGLEPPGAVVGASDDNAKRFCQLASFETKYLLRRHGWSVLVKEATVTGTGAANYALPSDFDRIVPATLWTSSSRWKIGGSVSSQRWQAMQNAWYVSTSLSRQVMMRATSGARQLYFEPELASGETVAYDYISKNMFDDGMGAQTDTWSDDSYTSLIDEHLITLGLVYRVLQSLGRDASFAFGEYNDALKTLIAQDAPAERLQLGSDEFVLPAVTPETITVP